MGTQCSTENTNLTIKEMEKSYNLNIDYLNCNSIKFFTFKSLKEYFTKMDFIKSKFDTICSKIEIYNDLSGIDSKNTKDIEEKQLKKKIVRRLKTGNNDKKSIYTIEKLYDVMSTIFHRINSVYGNSFGFPRQELGKINFDLISRYLSYEEDSTSDDMENVNVSNKIIKRINFFTEDFPFKLSKLPFIISSKKIFSFGYDIDKRLTIYLRPYYEENNIEINKYKRKSKSIENMDYIVYILFLIEHIIPFLKEKYCFSDEISIIYDSNNKPVNIELIRMILYYINLFHPLVLLKIMIVNAKLVEESNLKDNQNFIKKIKNQLREENKFSIVSLEDHGFKLDILKRYNPNCIPIEYGGYFNLNNFWMEIPNSEKLNPNLIDKLTAEELVEIILSLILIKEVY